MNFLILLKLVATFLAGLGLGLLYFGGLWMTVHRLPTTKHPYRLVFTSFFLRLALILFFFSELLQIIPLVLQWKFFVVLLLGLWLGRRIWIVWTYKKLKLSGVSLM